MMNNIFIQDLADRVATDYIKSQVPLNDSITKLAKEENLNPEAVARVVERANTGVQVALFSEMGPKDTFEFPLASTEAILSGLNHDALEGYEEKPIAEGNSIVKESEHAPKMTKLAKWSDDIATSDWNPNHMTHDQVLLHASESFAQAEAEMKSILIESETDLEKTAEEFVEECRQGFVEGELDPEDVIAGVVYFRPNTSDLVCNLVKEAVYNTRPVDSAENYSNIPPAYLAAASNTRPVKVIDSNHSLIQTLDTLVSQARSVDSNQRGLYLISDKVKYIKTKVQDCLSREYEKDVR